MADTNIAYAFASYDVTSETSPEQVMHDVGEQIAFSRESELQLTVVQFDNTATSTIRVVIIKTTCHPHKQKTLQKQFLAGKTRLGENLALLQPGEGEVIINGHPFLATWT